jgi:hypothetical protein
VELTVQATRSGRYAFDVQFTKALDYAIVEVSIDGSRIGELFDGYGSPLAVPSGEVSFGIVELNQGPHRIRFTAVDKNTASKNYFMGIDCLKLEPVN